MLWGNKDASGANTGTIEIYANGHVAGSSTLFTTELKIGNYIIADSKKFLVVSIANTTVAKVQASVLGAAVATVAASNTYIVQQGPAFVAASLEKIKL